MNWASINKLNLKPFEYAIFGSGPMIIRGLRDSHDIDIIVKEEAWEKLANMYNVIQTQSGDKIEIDNIEIWKEWMELTPEIDTIINSTDIIDGMSFANLQYVIKTKRLQGRDKDLLDIQIIENYLNQENIS